MNKHLWQFIGIIGITFFVFVGYSFSNFDIGYKGFTLKKANFKQYIMNDDSIFAEMYEPLAFLYDTVPEEVPVVVDTTAQRILLIGDSMLEGLMLRVRDYAIYNGHEQKSVIWYSSQSKWYGESDTLAYYVKKFKPTYIMLCLGANELFIRDIKKDRLKYVKNIISQMDTIPYVWIGPPNWKDDTGINELIVENTGEENYYPSLNLSYRRTRDGAHPTHSSAAQWMDSVAHWITNESNYRIKLVQPDKKQKGSPHATLLQPLK